MSTEIDKTNSSSSGGDYVVCKGATCSCSAGSVPCVALKISQDKVFINDATGDKAVATVSDNVFQVSSQPFGTCSLNPDKKSGQPCMYQPGSEWTLQTDMSTHPEVQGKAVLTEKGELLCPVFSGKISIVTHGQQIVAGNTSPKADGALSSQISPLSSTEKLPKEDKRKTASVQNVYCKEVKQTAKAGNSHTETVCIEEELTFVAKDANNKEIDKNKFKVEEIYWALCRWTDKNKKEFVVEQLTQGSSFTHIFNKKGDYFVEGYGKRKSTGEEEVYSRKTKGNCFFEIRVRKNELKRVLLGKEVIFEMGKPVKKPLELIAHFDYKLSYEYLFNKKKSHIEAVVKEANSETPVSDGLVKIGNEGVYQLKVTEEGKEPFVVRIKTVTNKIVKLLPVGIEGGLNKVRPYSSVTFELFLEKKLEETKAEEQIYWTVTEGGFTKRTKGDTKYSEFFTKKGLYRIEATVEGIATRASYQLEVLDNGVQRLVVTDKKELYPTHKDIYIKAETVFDSLSNNEEIEWKVTPLGGLEGDVVVQHNYVNKNEIRISANVEGSYWISAKVVSKGLSLGKAPLSDIGNSVTIKVEKTHIEQWYFSDSKGNRRSTIGWWQPFWVRVSAPLLREQEATLHFWLDTQEKDKSHTARFKEICSQKVKFSPQGFLKEKIEKDFWQKIEKLPAFYECKGERRFFFTLSGISSVIDNYNKEIHQSSFKDINGHILIDAVRDVYMNVVAGVRLLGYFTQDKLVEKLTHVVRYGEQVKMVLYVMYPQGYDINKRSKSFYFKLFENKKGEDIKLISREGLTPNEEGRIEVALNTDYKGNNGGIRQADHPKDTPYLPRLFYCKFYNKKEDWEQDKNEIFTYPDAYGTAGDNDAYLDVQLDEKTTEQEAKEKVEALKAKRFNYFEQLKIAKDPVLDKSLSGAGVKIGVKPEEEKKESCECFCKKAENQFYWSNRIGCKERKKVLEVCAELWGEANKIQKASELMSIIHLESKDTFSPYVENGRGYTGLIQFGDSAAKSVGTTREALRKMTFIEQMDYVKKYFLAKKDLLKTMVDLYLLVIKPNAVGNGNNPNYILFDESIEVPNVPYDKNNLNKEPWVTKYGYASNPSFMKEKDEAKRREHETYSKGKQMRPGFIGGKTYVWEVEKEIRDSHYNLGKSEIFRGRCEECNEILERAPWMDIAIQEAIKSNGSMESENPLYSMIKDGYHKFAGESDPIGTPWCASFASWCLNESGVSVPKTNRASSQAFIWFAGKNYRKITEEELKKGYIYGSIVVFTNFSDKSRGHVGFLMGMTKDGLYLVLGGNQGGTTDNGTQKITISSFGTKTKTKYLNGFYIPIDYLIKDKDYLTNEEKNYLNSKEANDKLRVIAGTDSDQTN